MVKKCEVRAIVNPKYIKSKLKELNAKKVKVSDGRDFYFDKDLFENGFHLRIREQTMFYPRKKRENYLTLKVHEPDFRKMNLYNTLTVDIFDKEIMKRILTELKHKRIFIEIWKNCEEFKLNNMKVELFYLKGWDWLMEIESIIKKSKKYMYNKVLKVLSLFDLHERDLIPTEPAVYVFNKKYK